MTEFVSSEEVQKRLDAQRAKRIAASGRMQCKVCWYIYDPAEGCPETQTPPGTPFSELPEWWSCPHCDTPAALFLPGHHAQQSANTAEATDGNQTR